MGLGKLISRDGKGKRKHAGYTRGCIHPSTVRPYTNPLHIYKGTYEPFREATTIRIANFSIITVRVEIFVDFVMYSLPTKINTLQVPVKFVSATESPSSSVPWIFFITRK